MMQDVKRQETRRKLLKWSGLSSLALLFFGAGLRKFITPKKTADHFSEAKTEKMLTQDGKLVEVDVSKLPAAKTKATNDEIHEWVKI